MDSNYNIYKGVNTLLGEVMIPISTDMIDYETVTVSLNQLTELGIIDRLGFKGPYQANLGDSILIKSITLNKYIECGICNVDIDDDGICDNDEVLGCIDSEASNYDIFATEDDGSCQYMLDNPCDVIPSNIFVNNIIHNRVTFNWSSPIISPSYYMIRYRPVGTSMWSVITAGPQNTVPYDGTSRTRYFMQAGTTYEWNIRARLVNNSGVTICQSLWSDSDQFTTLPTCNNLENLNVNSEANVVFFNANEPVGSSNIWQVKGKIRELGSNDYRYLPTMIDGYNNQIKYNFIPNTVYEWHTKAWCLGNLDELGNSDLQYHSGWNDFNTFSTKAICDKLPINLSSSSNNSNTAITMSWETPTSGQPHHYFLELINLTTGQVFSWNNLSGSINTKTKYGQNAGNQFIWRIRGACGENGTTWATPFTEYENYTLEVIELVVIKKQLIRSVMFFCILILLKENLILVLI